MLSIVWTKTQKILKTSCRCLKTWTNPVRINSDRRPKCEKNSSSRAGRMIDRPVRREAARGHCRFCQKSRRGMSFNNNAIDRRNICNVGRRNYRSSMREGYSAGPKTGVPRPNQRFHQSPHQGAQRQRGQSRHRTPPRRYPLVN